MHELAEQLSKAAPEMFPWSHGDVTVHVREEGKARARPPCAPEAKTSTFDIKHALAANVEGPAENSGTVTDRLALPGARCVKVWSSQRRESYVP